MWPTTGVKSTRIYRMFSHSESSVIIHSASCRWKIGWNFVVQFCFVNNKTSHEAEWTMTEFVLPTCQLWLLGVNIHSQLSNRHIFLCVHESFSSSINCHWNKLPSLQAFLNSSSNLLDRSLNESWENSTKNERDNVSSLAERYLSSVERIIQVADIQEDRKSVV